MRKELEERRLTLVRNSKVAFTFADSTDKDEYNTDEDEYNYTDDDVNIIDNEINE